MTQPPLVSVITIFLDAEAFLREAIESVFAQTYTRWELILVDDGSGDGSTDVALSYARQHPGRIRYLEHPGHRNRGMSASRNLGIAHARGELVALLDADDVWLPSKLEGQVEALGAHPEAAMVYDAARMWHSWAGRPGTEQLDRLRSLGAPPGMLVAPPALIPRFLRGEAETPGTCSVLLRREAIDAVGGFEESFPGMYEDQAFFYKVCLDFRVLLADGATALYRQHPRSACHLAEASGLYHPRRPHAARRPFLEWLAAYLAGRGSAADPIHRAVDAELWAYRHPTLHWVATGIRSAAGPVWGRIGRIARRVLPSSLRPLPERGAV